MKKFNLDRAMRKINHDLVNGKFPPIQSVAFDQEDPWTACVILDAEGTAHVGQAKRCPCDVPNPDRGMQLALKRAVQKHVNFIRDERIARSLGEFIEVASGLYRGKGARVNDSLPAGVRRDDMLHEFAAVLGGFTFEAEPADYQRMVGG